MPPEFHQGLVLFQRGEGHRRRERGRVNPLWTFHSLLAVPARSIVRSIDPCERTVAFAFAENEPHHRESQFGPWR